MRNRLTESDIEQKPANEIVAEFLATLKSQSPDENSNQQSQLLNKSECMKKFHNRVKICFSNSSNSTLTKLLSAEDKILFENELLSKHKEISVVLIHSLIQPESNLIRILAIRIILILTHLKKYHDELQNLNINIYVIRLIDLDLSLDETALSIEYIRVISQLYPSDLNEAHFYCLISSVEDSKYRLNNLILETILEMVCKRPKTACKCHVFNDLISYVVNVGNENEFAIEVVMQSLIKCLDRPECRKILRFDDLFSTLVAPFLDLEYVPIIVDHASHKNIPTCYESGQGNLDNLSDPKIEAILGTCSSALLTVFKR